MSTTVLNSYLGPVMKKYVNNFQTSVREMGIQAEPYITQSNGSIISIKETIDCPIKCAVSGPSAGVVAASFIGRQCNADTAIACTPYCFNWRTAWRTFSSSNGV